MKKRENGTLTTSETAELFGVTKRTVSQWIADGKMRSAFTAGGSARISLRVVIGHLFDGDMEIDRSKLPYSDAELVHFGVPQKQVERLKGTKK